MSKAYKFYYDESGHTRKLTDKMFKDNFYHFFTTCFIGIEKDKEKEVFEEYLKFENKYKNSYAEIKSSIISIKDCKRGLASINKNAKSVYNEFLDFLYKNNIKIRIYCVNKIEYLLRQIFIENAKEAINFLSWSISQILFLHHEQKILKPLLNNDVDKFINLLKKKLNIILNEQPDNDEYEQENAAILKVLPLLNIVKINRKIDYNFPYKTSFFFFKRFLKESNIKDYNLFIDEEGSGRVLESAKEAMNNSEVSQLNSKESAGIRMADLLCGLVSRLIFVISENTEYPSEENNNKQPFDDWLEMDKTTFELYRKFAAIFDENNKDFRLDFFTYSDPYFMLFLFVFCFTQFKDFDDYFSCTIDYLKSYIYENIERIITDIKQNL